MTQIEDDARRRAERARRVGLFRYELVQEVSGLLPHLDRIATLLWPKQPCLRYRSTAAAVTAIRLDHTHPAHLSGPSVSVPRTLSRHAAHAHSWRVRR